jgi:hypothetical protein
MGKHGNYVKKLLEDVAGTRFISSGECVNVEYSGVTAKIDGVIKECCAIEVESRVDKQIRGALLDLLEHHLPKKLLIIVPVHMTNPEKTVEHCQEILKRYNAIKNPKAMPPRVIPLQGTGEDPYIHEKEDRELIKKTLEEMGCL